MTNVQLRSRVRTAVATAPAEATTWLWTFGGVCFGYRRGESLFTAEGAEVGRFAGHEIYGADGRYLGEATSSQDGVRLITNTYKRSRVGPTFVPTLGRAYDAPDAQFSEPLYTGHEEFPSPETLFRTYFPTQAASRLLRDTSGQDMVEYALMAAVVAVSSVALMPSIAANISTIFSKTLSTLVSAGG